MIRDGIKLEEGNVQAFLMIGQSNMAGRGEFSDVPPIQNPLCYMLRMGRWQKMREPVNPDRSIFTGKFHSGTSLAAAFADKVALHTGERVGLIPCADGGTCIDQWMPGEVLFDHAVLMTKLALRSSRLCGILWHQGESDCNTDEQVRAHREKFVTMITALRRALGAEDIPLIIGELAEQVVEGRESAAIRHAAMNRQYHTIARELPCCAVASSAGLALKEDGLHFDAVSLRTFGERYFEEYARLVGLERDESGHPAKA